MVAGNFDNMVIIADADGFPPPAQNGTINFKYATLVYTETSKNLFSLPDGAEIVAWRVVITEAFNDSGTDVLDLGITGTLEKFAVDLDLSSIATFNEATAGFVEAELLTPQADAVTVVATFTGQNGNSSAGAARIGVGYILR